jgi:hypothetical protein
MMLLRTLGRLAVVIAGNRVVARWISGLGLCVLSSALYGISLFLLFICSISVISKPMLTVVPTRHETRAPQRSIP